MTNTVLFFFEKRARERQNTINMYFSFCWRIKFLLKKHFHDHYIFFFLLKEKKNEIFWCTKTCVMNSHLFLWQILTIKWIAFCIFKFKTDKTVLYPTLIIYLFLKIIWKLIIGKLIKFFIVFYIFISIHLILQTSI